jgi:hypothetical protein
MAIIFAASGLPRQFRISLPEFVGTLQQVSVPFIYHSAPVRTGIYQPSPQSFMGSMRSEYLGGPQLVEERQLQKPRGRHVARLTDISHPGAGTVICAPDKLSAVCDWTNSLHRDIGPNFSRHLMWNVPSLVPANPEPTFDTIIMHVTPSLMARSECLQNTKRRHIRGSLSCRQTVYAIPTPLP